MDKWLAEISRECENLGHSIAIEISEKRGAHRIVQAASLPLYISSHSSPKLVAKMIAASLDREVAVHAEMRRIRRLIAKSTKSNDKTDLWIGSEIDNGGLLFIAEVPSYTHSYRPDRMSFFIYEGDQEIIDEVQYNASKNRKIRSEIKRQNRLRVLKCCPVLAKMIMTKADPGAWADMIETALIDLNAGDQIHFNNGKLVHGVALSDRARWMSNRITLQDPLPETVTSAIAGRPLREVVTHPLIPEDAEILRAYNKDGKTIIHVKCADAPLLPMLHYLQTKTRKAKVGQAGFQWKSRKSNKLPRMKAYEKR